MTPSPASLLLSAALLAPAVGAACSCSFVAATPCQAISRAAALADGTAAEYDDPDVRADSFLFAAIVVVGEGQPVAEGSFADTAYAVTVEEQLAGRPVDSTFLLSSGNSAACGVYFRYEPGQRVLVVGTLGSFGAVAGGGDVAYPTYCSDYESVYPITDDRITYQRSYDGEAAERTHTLDELRSAACADTTYSLSTPTLDPAVKGRTQGVILVGDELTVLRPDGGAVVAPATVVVFDAAGREALRSSPRGPIDVGGLAPGLYYALLRDEDGDYRAAFVKP